jgi:hypothetical protein
MRRRDELFAQISSLGLAVPKSPPDMSSLSEEIFGTSRHYRILSAILHVQPWAMIQVSFQVVSVNPEAREATYSKGLENEIVLYMVTFGAELIAKPAWLWTIYTGQRQLEMRESLNAMYDALELRGLTRPWSVENAG